MTVHALRLNRRANESIEHPLDAGEEAAMIAAASRKLAELLDILNIDHRNDHNTRETPDRVAKMYVKELLRGRFAPPPRLTDFDNAQRYDQLIVVGPIEVRSLCAHHLMPIYGSAYIGVLPDPEGRIIGLSKYDRVVEHFAARLQIQEELVKQIGNFLVEETQPRGLAVRVSAVHMCKTHRGVRAPHTGRMVNTALYGAMRESQSLKDEFLRECSNLERGN
ncbi:MAG TPA: GTP cyclohydrolase I [Stellaceae bacterium]|nr:GTP cyclohydrolase I [Stellaceae bacterium]